MNDKAIREWVAGIAQSSNINIHDVVLVSARTSFGVNRLFQVWDMLCSTTIIPIIMLYGHNHLRPVRARVLPTASL